MRAQRAICLVSVGQAGVLALLLCGCAAANNERTTLGSEFARESEGLGDLRVELPALSPSERLDSRPASEGTGPVRGEGSLRGGLGRTHFATTTILVPVDGVEGAPTYGRWAQRTSETARQRNEFPSPSTALELSGDEIVQRDEILLAPLRGIMEGVAAPVRMVMHAPWQAVRHVPRAGWRARPGTALAPERELERLRALDTPVGVLTAPVSGDGVKEGE